MAPNTKQLHLLVQQFNPEDLAVIKPRYAPLTQENEAPVQQLNASDEANYWTWEEPGATEQDSYWDWSENPSKDILTTDHIVLNLMNSRNTVTEMVHAQMTSDFYWDETSPKDQECRPVVAQHDENSHLAQSYWEWPGEEKVRKEMIINEILQEEKVRQMFTSQHIVSKLQQQASGDYWNDSTLTLVSEEQSYWDWEPQVDCLQV